MSLPHATEIDQVRRSQQPLSAYLARSLRPSYGALDLLRIDRWQAVPDDTPLQEPGQEDLDVATNRRSWRRSCRCRACIWCAMAGVWRRTVSCLPRLSQRYANNPRSRGLSEHRVFSCEECGFPAHVPGWRDHWEAHVCLQCQAQRVPRDTAGRCEPVDCNMTVFRRTLVSILHSQVKKIAWFNRTP